MSPVRTLLLLAVSLLACTGVLTEPGPPPGPPEDNSQLAPLVQTAMVLPATPCEAIDELWTAVQALQDAEVAAEHAKVPELLAGLAGQAWSVSQEQRELAEPLRSSAADAVRRSWFEDPNQTFAGAEGAIEGYQAAEQAARISEQAAGRLGLYLINGNVEVRTRAATQAASLQEELPSHLRDELSEAVSRWREVEVREEILALLPSSSATEGPPPATP